MPAMAVESMIEYDISSGIVGSWIGCAVRYAFAERCVAGLVNRLIGRRLIWRTTCC